MTWLDGQRSITARPFTVEGPGDTTCDECGWPIFAGDRAYTTNLEVVPEVGCTRTCAESFAARTTA